jgi:hypothetical protein
VTGIKIDGINPTIKICNPLYLANYVIGRVYRKSKSHERKEKKLGRVK